MSEIAERSGSRSSILTQDWNRETSVQSRRRKTVSPSTKSLPKAVSSKDAQRTSSYRVAEVSNRPDVAVLQSSVEQRMDSMVSAIQFLSDRLGSPEQNGMDFYQHNTIYPCKQRSSAPIRYSTSCRTTRLSTER